MIIPIKSIIFGGYPGQFIIPTSNAKICQDLPVIGHLQTVGGIWPRRCGTYGFWAGLVKVNKKRTGKIHHAMFMGKATISTGPFSIAM